MKRMKKNVRIRYPDFTPGRIAFPYRIGGQQHRQYGYNLRSCIL